jgi:ABC-type sugar transport system substrate-binding protein
MKKGGIYYALTSLELWVMGDTLIPRKGEENGKMKTKIFVVLLLALALVGPAAVLAQQSRANNDDLVGPKLGPDLGFGPIGVDIDSLVKRMGPKMPKIKLSVQVLYDITPWSQIWVGTIKNLMKKYNINYQMFDARADSTVEAQQIDTAINMGVDGIIDYYVEPGAAVASINKAIDAGIYVVPVFPNRDSKAQISRAGTDVNIGEIVARRAVKDFAGQKMTVAIANWYQKYGILDERLEGYEKVLASAPNVTLLKNEYVLGKDADEFFNRTFDLLSRNSQINCILCSYGEAMVDCSVAVQKAGRKVAVYGVDIDQSICQKVKDGLIAGTQPYDARINAYMSLFTILRLINGDKNVQSWNDPYADLLITKENVDHYADVTFGVKLN